MRASRETPVFYERDDKAIAWVVREDARDTYSKDEPYGFKAYFDKQGKAGFVTTLDLATGIDDGFYLVERQASLEEMLFFAERLQQEDHDLAREVVSHVVERVTVAVRSLGTVGLMSSS
ncbi:hypothetical protein HY218_01615 [Candidatus Saccharibacteria bacterium]|nr:hypothetical protein [Candidatus Saccharibacteria bacterium]